MFVSEKGEADLVTTYRKNLAIIICKSRSSIVGQMIPGLRYIPFSDLGGSRYAIFGFSLQQFHFLTRLIVSSLIFFFLLAS